MCNSFSLVGKSWGKCATIIAMIASSRKGGSCYRPDLCRFADENRCSVPVEGR